MTDQQAAVLVVANRTAASEELFAALRERSESGPAVKFTLLVPRTPHGVDWVGDMHAGGAEAEAHMQAAVERLRGAGFDVEGILGDPDPVAAVEDAVNFSDFDEIIVSTLPTHVSKWLKLDLPHRVERATGLPVTHITASQAGAPE